MGNIKWMSSKNLTPTHPSLGNLFTYVVYGWQSCLKHVDIIMAFVFSRGLATLDLAVSVGRSVGNQNKM